MAQVAKYGSWVSWKLIIVPAALAVVFGALAALLVWLVIPAALLLLVTGYFGYARYLMSPHGKDVQSQVHDLVLQHLEWAGRGKVLDIGCGSAALTIKLAKKYRTCKVVGVDYWGSQWEYSQKECESNAKAEGVSKRLEFTKASASSLPFKDSAFDAVVSNLVFHEVRDCKDKLQPIREALRVLKRGGRFTFQDLFFEQRLYGKPGDLVERVKRMGVKKVAFIRTRDASFIPGALKPPFMLGTLGLLTGEKR
jgi:SAM-dependent methyltransferase